MTGATKNRLYRTLALSLVLPGLMFAASCSKMGLTSGTEAGKQTAQWQRFSEEDINFEYDKYRLLPRAKRTLWRKAKWLMTNPDVSVMIEGHCDERGTREYNNSLGGKRASAAKNFLTDMGISPKRLETHSYGEDRPLDRGHTEKAWAKNRRAHFS